MVSEAARQRVETERGAFAVLQRRYAGMHRPSAWQKRAVVEAWRRLGRNVTGAAFDMLRLRGDFDVWLATLNTTPSLVQCATLLEVKSTKTYDTPRFAGMFFSLTEAEIQNAEALGRRFVFAFVNPLSERVHFASLSEIRRRGRMHLRWAVTLR
jgi:hypothetical protein